MSIELPWYRKVHSQDDPIVLRHRRGGKERPRRLLFPLCLILLLFPLCLVGALAAKDRGTGKQQSLESLFHGSRVLRCMFQEKRLVLTFGGELYVLHVGESLPAAGMKVTEANEAQIVLETLETRQLPSGVSVPEAIVVLYPGEDGGLRTRIFSSDSGEGTDTHLVPQMGVGAAMSSGVARSDGRPPASPAQSDDGSDGVQGP